MGPLLRKRIQLIATTLKSRSPEYKGNLISSLRRVLFPNAGEQSEAQFTPKPVVDRVFNMTQAKEAHEFMESN